MIRGPVSKYNHEIKLGKTPRQAYIETVLYYREPYLWQTIKAGDGNTYYKHDDDE